MAISISREDFYVIRDGGGRIIALYQPNQGKRARTRAEKMNAEYGAHKYHVIKIKHLSGAAKANALMISDWRRYDWAI